VLAPSPHWNGYGVELNLATTIRLKAMDEVEYLSDFTDCDGPQSPLGFALTPLNSNRVEEESLLNEEETLSILFESILEKHGADGVINELSKLPICEAKKEASHALNMLNEGMETSDVEIACETLLPLVERRNASDTTRMCDFITRSFLKSSKDVDKLTLVESGFSSVVTSLILEGFCDSQSLAQNYAQLFRELARTSSENRTVLCSDGCLDAIARLMHTFPNSIQLDRLCCETMRSFVTEQQHKLFLAVSELLDVVALRIPTYVVSAPDVAISATNSLYQLLFELEELARNGSDMFNVLRALCVISGSRGIPPESRGKALSVLAAILLTTGSQPEDLLIEVAVKQCDIGREIANVLKDIDDSDMVEDAIRILVHIEEAEGVDFLQNASLQQGLKIASELNVGAREFLMKISQRRQEAENVDDERVEDLKSPLSRKSVLSQLSPCSPSRILSFRSVSSEIDTTKVCPAVISSAVKTSTDGTWTRKLLVLQRILSNLKEPQTLRRCFSSWRIALMKVKAKECDQVKASLKRERTERAAIEGEVAALRFDKEHGESTFQELETAANRVKELERILASTEDSLRDSREESQMLREEIINMEKKCHKREREFEEDKETVQTIQTDFAKACETIQSQKQMIENLTKVVQGPEGVEALRVKVNLLEAQLQEERDSAAKSQNEKIESVKRQMEMEYQMVIKAMTASRLRLGDKTRQCEMHQKKPSERKVIQRKQRKRPWSDDPELQQLFVELGAKSLHEETSSSILPRETLHRFASDAGLLEVGQGLEKNTPNQLSFEDFVATLSSLARKTSGALVDGEKGPVSTAPEASVQNLKMHPGFRQAVSELCAGSIAKKESEEQENEHQEISEIWQAENKPLRDIFVQYMQSFRDRKSHMRSKLDKKTTVHQTISLMEFEGFLQMCAEFDILPSLATRMGLRKLFNSVAVTRTIDDREVSGLSFHSWLFALESIAVQKFPSECSGRNKAQVAALLQWLDASQGKRKLQNRKRGGSIIRKFSINLNKHNKNNQS